MHDGNVYWSKDDLDRENTTADILAVGDSWFWYLFPGGSLINQIGQLVAPRGHNILVEGNNGAEAYDYVKGKYKRQVGEMLRLYGSTASALLISGGGNDFAGFNDLRPLLRRDCTGAASAPQCFEPGVEEGRMEWLFQRIFENYALLISRALFVMPPHGRILLHTYDYAVPNGKGVFGGAGWLKPALESAAVPPALQAPCVRLLLDHFHSVLQRLADNAGGRVLVVDCRGTLGENDWANELHPRPRGFKTLATRCWQPVLQSLDLA